MLNYSQDYLRGSNKQWIEQRDYSDQSMFQVLSCISDTSLYHNSGKLWTITKTAVTLPEPGGGGDGGDMSAIQAQTTAAVANKCIHSLTNSVITNQPIY